jgi:hypothetical protein
MSAINQNHIDPTSNLLRRLMPGESLLLDYVVDLRIVGSEIWLWDDRADQHFRMTKQELSQICTGWEEMVDELPRLRLPHSSSWRSPASWLMTYEQPACKAA